MNAALRIAGEAARIVTPVGIKAGKIFYPDYLPGGESRVQDPDGYTLMLGQAAADTP